MFSLLGTRCGVCLWAQKAAPKGSMCRGTQAVSMLYRCIHCSQFTQAEAHSQNAHAVRAVRNNNSNIRCNIIPEPVSGPTYNYTCWSYCLPVSTQGHVSFQLWPKMSEQRDQRSRQADSCPNTAVPGSKLKCFPATMTPALHTTARLLTPAAPLLLLRGGKLPHSRQHTAHCLLRFSRIERLACAVALVKRPTRSRHWHGTLVGIPSAGAPCGALIPSQ